MSAEGAMASSHQRNRGAHHVFFDSVGCRLNQSEIESLSRQFRRAGHILVEAPEHADLMVLNTCSVTAGADCESRRRIRTAMRANPHLQIAVTGCWATLNAEEASQLPGVRAVIPNELKGDLPAEMGLAAPPDLDLEPLERRPLPGIRRRTRAYLKAQDGCNQRCAFCLTTIARGPARSLPLERVLRQAHSAEEGGAKEIVLSGVQLSSYGRDLAGEVTLTTLLTELMRSTGIPRIRLSSLEPWGLPEGLFDLLEEDRLCRQLHLPLQSGSLRTLRRMARPMTAGEYEGLVQTARRRIPDVAVTTDILVGFPGETEEEFEESLAFIRRLNFADAHVFRFSTRPGTRAAELPDPVPSRETKERAATVRAAVQRSSREYQQGFLGREVRVLWEAASPLGPNEWQLSGLTDNYLRVRANARTDLWNSFSRVRLEAEGEKGLEGPIVHP